MKIEVIIPAIRSPWKLLWSLGKQSRPPDQITVVSNEFVKPPFDVSARILRFTSEDYPYGYRDVVLRRNIGIWESDADAIIFQDDDQIAPRTLIEEMEKLLGESDVVWGHHRFIDFNTHDPALLIDMDPEMGRARENGVNQSHLYQSGYAGCLGVRRDLILRHQGFDMLFLGRHGSEDQNLAKRMCGERIFVHEPPFSWHPTEKLDWLPGPTNTCTDEHDWEPDVYNDVVFSRCSRCPLWRFADRKEQLFRDEVVVPYEHRLVDVTVEAI